jgi:uncharacterized Zn finger protein (UPF0148 family)
MAHTTTCPACGAPLEYTDDHEVVHCIFCETDIEVFEEDGETRFRVVALPEETSEELSRRAQRELGDIPTQPDAGDEPVAPGYISAGAADSDPDVYSPEAVLPQVPVMTEPIPEVQAHYTQRSDDFPPPAPSAPAARSNRNRWIGIGLAVFIVVCISCACLVAVLMGAGWLQFQ